MAVPPLIFPFFVLEELAKCPGRRIYAWAVRQNLRIVRSIRDELLYLFRTRGTNLHKLEATASILYGNAYCTEPFVHGTYVNWGQSTTRV